MTLLICSKLQRHTTDNNNGYGLIWLIWLRAASKSQLRLHKLVRAYLNSHEMAISRDLASRGEHSLSTRIAVCTRAVGTALPPPFDFGRSVNPISTITTPPPPLIFRPSDIPTHWRAGFFCPQRWFLSSLWQTEFWRGFEYLCQVHSK